MTEKIAIKEVVGANEFGWAMTTVMSKVAVDVPAAFNIAFGDETVDVEFRINGVEVSVKSVIDGLFSGFNAAVDAKAKELVRDRLYGRLSRLERSLDQACKAFDSELTE